MNIAMECRLVAVFAAFLVLAGCENESDTGTGTGEASSGAAEAPGQRVATTGKQDTALEAVPSEVLQVALKARPALQIAGSEYEVRDGREYYDLAGTLPDGAELELDMTRIDGVWTVVEVQRDLSLDQVPDDVRRALEDASPGWSAARIIESDQGDGVVIYEFFGSGADGADTKLEVKWTAEAVEVLSDEWPH